MLSRCGFFARTVGFHVLLLMLVLPALASAQETRATITGTVKDTQGAVIPGVTVTVLNTDTNVATEAVTNESGVFNVQKLQPGPVRITATLAGFKTWVREGITLRTAETVTINIPLAIGAVEETDHGERGEQRHRVERVHDLADDREQAHLGAAAERAAGLHDDAAHRRARSSRRRRSAPPGSPGTRAWDVNGSLSVHGSRTGNNEFLIEGAPSAGTGGGTGSWNYAPPVDAIEEFKIGMSAPTPRTAAPAAAW